MRRENSTEYMQNTLHSILDSKNHGIKLCRHISSSESIL